jgi:hypothetical protein
VHERYAYSILNVGEVAMSDSTSKIGSHASVIDMAAARDDGTPPASDPVQSKPKRSLLGMLSGLATLGGESKKQIARRVYDQHRMYHGTIEPSEKSLVENGFDISRKADGAAKAFGKSNLASTATDYHYLTSNKRMAGGYAEMASQGHFWSHMEKNGIDREYESPKPALVRVLVDRSKISLENDKDTANGSAAYDASFRTKDNIPPANILGSKRSKPGEDAKVYQGLLNQAGLEVSEKKAGKLLRRVQSDSDLNSNES